jgi:hypothetical protein
MGRKKYIVMENLKEETTWKKWAQMEEHIK